MPYLVSWTSPSEGKLLDPVGLEKRTAAFADVFEERRRELLEGKCRRIEIVVDAAIRWAVALELGHEDVVLGADEEFPVGRKTPDDVRDAGELLHAIGDRDHLIIYPVPLHGLFEKPLECTLISDGINDDARHPPLSCETERSGDGPGRLVATRTSIVAKMIVTAVTTPDIVGLPVFPLEAFRLLHFTWRRHRIDGQNTVTSLRGSSGAGTNVETRGDELRSLSRNQTTLHLPREDGKFVPRDTRRLVGTKCEGWESLWPTRDLLVDLEVHRLTGPAGEHEALPLRILQGLLRDVVLVLRCDQHNHLGVRLVGDRR